MYLDLVIKRRIAFPRRPVDHSFGLDYLAHLRAVVATVGMYSLALAFARLTLVEQLFKRGSVVDVGRGYVDGAD